MTASHVYAWKQRGRITSTQPVNIVYVRWGEGAAPTDADFAASVALGFDMPQCAVAHQYDEAFRLRPITSWPAEEALRTGQMRLRPHALGEGKNAKRFFGGVGRMLRYAQRGFRPPLPCWRLVRRLLAKSWDAFMVGDRVLAATCLLCLREILDVIPSEALTSCDMPAPIKPLAGRRGMKKMCEICPEALVHYALHDSDVEVE